MLGMARRSEMATFRTGGKQEAARTKFATLGGLGLTQTRVSFILVGPNSARSPKISCTTSSLFAPFLPIERSFVPASL